MFVQLLFFASLNRESEIPQVLQTVITFAAPGIIMHVILNFLAGVKYEANDAMQLGTLLKRFTLMTGDAFTCTDIDSSFERYVW